MPNMFLNGEFCQDKAGRMAWSDLLYGFLHGYVQLHGVVDYVRAGLIADSPEAEYDLATLEDSDRERGLELLSCLAEQDVVDGERARRVWIYLFFQWLIENRAAYDDPFEIIEEWYADFGYPEEVSSIVRYMPLPEGAQGGEAYLMSNWQSMLNSLRLDLGLVNS